MAPSQRQNPYLPQLDKNSLQLNRDTQAQHPSSHCMPFLCIGKKEVSGYSFQFYVVSGVIEGISTVTEGQGESCVSYKVLHDTAGLAEEKRMPSPVPATHQKLT